MSKNLVVVSVESFFVPDQSSSKESRYFFAYRIRIENNGPTAVQLLNRHWIITDGLGRVEEVKGEGVIGQKPRLEPGGTFEYESFCPLSTPTGVMRGSYEMTRDDGSRFQVQIPQFFLVEPNSFH